KSDALMKSLSLLGLLIVTSTYCYSGPSAAAGLSTLKVKDTAHGLFGADRVLSSLISNVCCFTDKTCPAGWTMFNSSCYFLSNQTSSWTQGRKDCMDRGPDLVVIDSAEEQVQLSLSKFTKLAAWIGLTDRDNEGTWEWVDGNPLTLKYWAQNQLDNYGKNPWDCEDYAEKLVRTAKWSDLPCENTLHWICEKIP
uniref:C-type lectin domain-containing protein n=1 Tax=Anabas testudineus TaxID=64144 RepID=A0A3Q1JTJ1_ANATE